MPWGPWRDYVALTKPRIMSLLLITGFCGMIAGARGWPGTGLAVAAMVGLALACGGASALNHVLDRDIDPLMGSGRSARPVASGRVPPSRALEFGLALLGVLLRPAREHGQRARPLCSRSSGNLFYVLVYTRWLKRTTSQNIVIGGAAGAVPPLVGWAAATGNVDVAGAPPLRDRLRLDAAALLGARAADQGQLRERARADAAGRARRPRATARQIVLYSLALVGGDAPAVGLGGAGPLYVVSALALGAVFLWLAERLRRDTTPRSAVLLFHYSLLYLALLFVGARRRRGGLMDPELARKNVRLGWLLFGVFVLLFAGCVGVAFLYLHFQ